MVLPSIRASIRTGTCSLRIMASLFVKYMPLLQKSISPNNDCAPSRSICRSPYTMPHVFRFRSAFRPSMQKGVHFTSLGRSIVYIVRLTRITAANRSPHTHGTSVHQPVLNTMQDTRTLCLVRVRTRTQGYTGYHPSYGGVNALGGTRITVLLQLPMSSQGFPLYKNRTITHGTTNMKANGRTMRTAWLGLACSD
jgi:hypothetical protein